MTYRYVSIDIETLGLSEECDIIEFGAVLDDFETPLELLPKFHCYLTKATYVGEPYAMAIHSKILKRIADKEPGYDYIGPGFLCERFRMWLYEHDLKEKIVTAGKNFFGFDMKFLNPLKFYMIPFHHRTIDPGSMYYVPGVDKEPPGLDECLKRAGVEKSVEHTAVADALDVIRCIRAKVKNES